MNRFKGAMYGLALGDALGAPYEFRKMTKDFPYTGTLEGRNFYKKDRFGHVIDLVPGQVTDDTEMALILLGHIVKHKNIQKDELILDYLAWANDKTTFAVGRNMRALFKGVRTVSGYENRYEKINKNNQSNGSLMRCAPLVLVDESQWDEECAITNPHPVCLEVNFIFLSCLKGLIFHKWDVEECRNFLENFNPSEKIVKDCIIDILEKNPRKVDGKDKGWCMHAFYVAFRSLFEHDNFSDAIDWVIQQGGDTDTNGAIAGALLGGCYGFRHIQRRRGADVDILLNCDTTLGNKPRKEKYHPRVIEEYVEKAFAQ